jgi:hypothetical protein
MKNKLLIASIILVTTLVLITLTAYLLTANTILYGEIAAIWSVVFAPLFTDVSLNYEMPTDFVSGSVVLISGLVFAISYIYLSRKRKS